MLGRGNRCWRLWVLLACFAASAPALLAAQEESAAPEKPAAEKPAPEKPAPEKPAAEQAGKSAAEVYQEKFDEWRNLLGELRRLQAEYGKAEQDQLPQIRQRWNELIARGEALLPELEEAGRLAYEAAPQQDRELERFLVDVLHDDVLHDRYEQAARVSQTLIENGCDVDQVFDDGGVAAFAVNDYERAEKYLKRAEEEGVLSEKGQQFKDVLPEYKKLWEEEKKLREKEANENLPRVRISTTKGDMVVELFENEAPETVGNFISLVEKGFYDGLTFHRVLPQFMAQGGCPKGDGTGGPGYNIYCECYKPEHRKHFRGSLSMAHAGRDTGGSQFFITFVPTPFLNGKHTVFGRVVEGMDVLSKLQRIDPSAEGPKPEPDKMVKVEVIRKRDHEYKPHKVE